MQNLYENALNVNSVVNDISEDLDDVGATNENVLDFRDENVADNNDVIYYADAKSALESFKDPSAGDLGNGVFGVFSMLKDYSDALDFVDVSDPIQVYKQAYETWYDYIFNIVLDKAGLSDDDNLTTDNVKKMQKALKDINDKTVAKAMFAEDEAVAVAA